MSTSKNIKDMNIVELKEAMKAILAKETAGKKLSQLESFQLEIIPVMISEKEKAAKLQEKVDNTRTSANRQPKETDKKADMLLASFKALKSFVTFSDTKEAAIQSFADTAKLLKITINNQLVKDLIFVSIYHNSKSNIAKPTNNQKPVTYEHCKGMLFTFIGLLKEADILTGNKLTEADYNEHVNTVINKSYKPIIEADKKEALRLVSDYFKKPIK